MGGGGDDLGGEMKDILSEKKIILSIKEKNKESTTEMAQQLRELLLFHLWSQV